MNRRLFLRTTGLALLGVPRSSSGFLGFLGFVGGPPLRGTPRNSEEPEELGVRKGKTLVVLFQRGAVDGLNMIVPYGERAYYASRPTIAIGRKDVLDLDGFFGAHPSLQPLMPFWKDRSLAIVHAAGSPDATRSHFDAQDFMETGTPGVKSTKNGFLARALATTRGTAPRAVAITPALPRILAGAPDAIAASDLARFRNDGATKVFAAMYPEAFAAARVLASVNASGTPLQQVASLIQAGVGVEVAFVETGGWDTHAGQNVPLANNLKRMADEIAQFAKTLGSRMSDVVLVTMSEFGRTVQENGNRGTDHGHGTVMLVLGGATRGGKVHGRWPGLDRDRLFESRDLAVTTDFRDVFAEVLSSHLGIRDLARVFPNYSPKAVWG